MKWIKTGWLVGSTVVALALQGCGGSDSDTDSAAVGDFPVAYAKRSIESLGNPTDAGRFSPGGDLYLRALASPSAEEINITERITLGRGDVSDIEVSYDATRLLFSMKTESSSWDIWEYDIEQDQLRRLIADEGAASDGDDFDPTYLPDGRIIFSSNRQQRSREKMTAAGQLSYKVRDEYEREPSAVLHVMNSDGSGIRQLSFNQSHDRNPTILMTGEVMFSRWDHQGSRNHFPIFTMNPDGTNMFVLYGAFSGVNSFLHPREMPSGMVISTAMPLSGTSEGGALMQIDVAHYSENNRPAPNLNPDDLDSKFKTQGQVQATLNAINTGRGVSEFGRFTTPYPLWDGSNRVLVSWTPSNPEQVEGEMEESEPVYGLYMLDLDDKTQKPIALIDAGSALSITDGVAVQPRPQPNVIADKDLTGDLADREMALINVKSVYDTDEQNLMGQRMLVGNETIPMKTAAAGDTRGEVADLNQLKDPLSTFRQDTTTERPAWMLRVTRAVGTPQGMSQDSISQTGFEMQQIVGYTMIDPDGSFKVEMPGDEALAFTALDKKGRSIQVHTNWLLFRPGERRTCVGCHSPRRSSAINDETVSGSHPNTKLDLAAQAGESMAETRTRLFPEDLTLQSAPNWQDRWTLTAGDQAQPAEPTIAISYDQLTTPVPTDGIINYAEHLQPIWDKQCVSCHGYSSPAAGVDLTDGVSGTGRYLSYETLTVGLPELDAQGIPLLETDEDGVISVSRQTPLATVSNSRSGSRASYLTELLFGEELRATRSLPASPTVDHATLLNASELRVITEWIDLGAQYYNTPFVRGADNPDGSLGVFDLTQFRPDTVTLNQQRFEQQVHPVLMDRCASCHRPIGDDRAQFEPSRFILTGAAEGDFNITLSMIHDVMAPELSPLLVRASSDGIPPNAVHAVNQPVGSPVGTRQSILSSDVNDNVDGRYDDYQTIVNWILGGS